MVAFTDEGHRIMRAALGVNSRRWVRQGKLTPAQGRDVRDALKDDDTACLLCCAVEEELSQAERFAADPIDSIIKLLEWLIANADKIIALILKLLPLFTDA